VFAVPEKLPTKLEESAPSSAACVYTAISFAPVQGFIEKSRKLRDLDGASKILSYLCWKIVNRAEESGFRVISPARNDIAANADIIQGMPNRILIQGDFLQGYVASALAEGWKEIVTECHNWLTKNLQISEVGWINSWTRWKNHAWELFCGTGKTIDEAMRDLETRKLRRDWIVPNWNGESSSLSGHDAIAYPNMDSLNPDIGEITAFYNRLAEVLDPTEETNDHAYINEKERLSIPELIKRLITYEDIANEIHPELYTPSFREMLREDWTGWFMGDGDEVGKHLKNLSALPSPNDAEAVNEFSDKLRIWGSGFQERFEKERRGRVVYAGGDDFFGVMYSDQKGVHLNGADAIGWLIGLREQWRSGNLGINLSTGFVWAGHRVPQRDVLQHCREAEKRAKNLGRDRITIRVVFNNGQFVQWTTPWRCLEWLRDYCDRNDNTGKDANWSQVYTDLAQLKARHAIPPKNAANPDDAIALELFGLYFGEDKQEILSQQRGQITGAEGPKSMIEWIDGMIKVGWQLCLNS
jgi:CRISPR-associated protein Cmr2